MLVEVSSNCGRRLYCVWPLGSILGKEAQNKRNKKISEFILATYSTQCCIISWLLSEKCKSLFQHCLPVWIAVPCPYTTTTRVLLLYMQLLCSRGAGIKAKFAGHYLLFIPSGNKTTAEKGATSNGVQVTSDTCMWKCASWKQQHVSEVKSRRYWWQRLETVSPAVSKCVEFQEKLCEFNSAFCAQRTSSCTFRSHSEAMWYKSWNIVFFDEGHVNTPLL